MVNRRNLVDVTRVPVGMAQAYRAVKKFNPDVVLSTGGYVSVPTVLAAWLLRLPVVMHEQTITIGLANKVNALFATRITLSFEQTAAWLSGAERCKSVVTGNPVRPEVVAGDRLRALEFLGWENVENVPVVYITGGSQGSRLINRAIEGALPSLLAKCRIVHQCGKQGDGTEQDIDRLRAAQSALPADLSRRYFVTQYVGTEIGDIFALSDLVVGRSGAGTISELCAVGRASLLIPLVPASRNEQMLGARWLESAGAAAILEQSRVNPESMASSILTLTEAPGRLVQMANCAKKLARTDAVGLLACEVEHLAGVQDRKTVSG
jgi:UDP-N-acetylglucosamine--N-acetylmuramyl-(pentapeptide) pyrophosphoryl-undecaprenol N-acetylglucosamine transferase